MSEDTKNIFDAGNRYLSIGGCGPTFLTRLAADTGVPVPCNVNFFRVFAMTSSTLLSRVSIGSRNNSVAHRQLRGGALDCKHMKKQYRNAVQSSDPWCYGIDGSCGWEVMRVEGSRDWEIIRLLRSFLRSWKNFTFSPPVRTVWGLCVTNSTIL